MLKKIVDLIKKTFPELFFPQFCQNCKLFCNDTLCHKCLNLLQTFGYCMLENYNCFSLFIYNDISAKLLWEIKYNRNFFLITKCARTIAKIIAENNTINNTIIIPVPSYLKRRFQRGYYPVSSLGSSLAKYMNIPVYNNILYKTTNLLQKNAQCYNQRYEYAYKSYIIKNTSLLQGKFVLLVDDMITSGATVLSCANLISEHTNVMIVSISIAKKFLDFQIRSIKLQNF